MRRPPLQLSARSDDDRHDHHYVDEVEDDVGDHGGKDVSGTPEEVTSQSIEGVATVEEQLRLLADEVMPNFR